MNANALSRALLLIGLAAPATCGAGAAGAVAAYLQQADDTYGGDRLAAMFGRGTYKPGESIQTRLAEVYAAALHSARDEAERAAIESHWATLARCDARVLRDPGEKAEAYQARTRQCRNELEAQAQAVVTAGTPPPAP